MNERRILVAGATLAALGVATLGLAWITSDDPEAKAVPVETGVTSIDSSVSPTAVPEASPSTVVSVVIAPETTETTGTTLPATTTSDETTTTTTTLPATPGFASEVRISNSDDGHYLLEVDLVDPCVMVLWQIPPLGRSYFADNSASCWPGTTLSFDTSLFSANLGIPPSGNYTGSVTIRKAQSCETLDFVINAELPQGASPGTTIAASSLADTSDPCSQILSVSCTPRYVVVLAGTDGEPTNRGWLEPGCEGDQVPDFSGFGPQAIVVSSADLQSVCRFFPVDAVFDFYDFSDPANPKQENCA